MSGRDSGDEELTSIGTGACVCHRKQERPVMLLLEILILKLGAVDRFTAGSDNILSAFSNESSGFGVGRECTHCQQ